ncbi:L-type lectin-domain containing receptor [Vigna angularis]|uniref:L-type lectin-domain containing receptor n=1 Tax=Phaseolus angularis TaxID=3914 RepID=A0A8T0KQ47_PHAAN|nr:L-type lectin-domain containing receptor [Vigna angularis]
MCLLWYASTHHPDPHLPAKHVSDAGLSPSQLQKLPSITGKDLLMGSECVVCLDDIATDQPARLVPGCNHAFPVECADPAVPNSAAGRALYSDPIRFRQQGSPSPASFSTFFSFSVTNLNPSSIGGGLTFVISPDSTAVGDSTAVWVSYSTVRPKDPILKVDLDVGMYLNDFMYVGFSWNGTMGAVAGVMTVAGVVTAGAFHLALFAGAFIWVYSKKGFSANRVIGHGAFGTLYKGVLPESGDTIAVKRCNHSGQDYDAEALQRRNYE